MRAYRPLWLGLDPDGPRRPSSPDHSDGLVVAVDWAAPADDERVRAWFVGARAVARATCEAGPLTAVEVATLLEQRLRAWAGDREVVRVPSAVRA